MLVVFNLARPTKTGNVMQGGGILIGDHLPAGTVGTRATWACQPPCIPPGRMYAPVSLDWPCQGHTPNPWHTVASVIVFSVRTPLLSMTAEDLISSSTRFSTWTERGLQEQRSVLEAA